MRRHEMHSSPSQRFMVPHFASQMRTAFSSTRAKTGSRSLGELLMTCKTSDVAVCCSNARRGQPCVPQFVEQPRILDGDDRLGGEILD